MSLYTPWGAYNLSPTPNVLGPKPPTTNKQSVVDTHHPELQYGFNLAVPNCPRALNDHKSIHDARSINNYFVRPNPDRSTALPSADLGYAGYSLLPHNHADVSFPTTRHSVSPTESPHYWISSGPLSSTYEPFNHRDALMPQNAPRSFWNEEPGGTLNSESLPRVLPAISPQAYTSNVSNYPTYYPHQAPRSKAALFAEEWDHPSFARPPHQPIAQKSVAAVPRIATFPVIQALGLSSTPNEVDQPHESGELLVPDSYPVPPPPPYEQSAAPLADLAAKMVWERTVNSFPLRASSMPPPTSDLLSPAVDSGFSWGPTLSETRSPYDAGYPLTRFGSQRDTAYTNHRHSIAASVFGVIGAEVKARREQHSQQQAIQPLKSDVKPAFKQWTRQVLEETLLSPQVLVLALYYVDMLRGKDVFGDVARGKSSLVPYKMLLAGLVLANKTLDDHSYKNSTFANVSSMSNSDVNTIEVAMLSALQFETVPRAQEWTEWVAEVVSTAEQGGIELGGTKKTMEMKKKKQEEEIITLLKYQPHHQRSPFIKASIFDQALQDWSGGGIGRPEAESVGVGYGPSGSNVQMLSTAEIYRDQLRMECMQPEYG